MSLAYSRKSFEPVRIDLSKVLDKPPPQAVEAEMALLGSMLLDKTVIGDVVQILSGAEDFIRPAHGVIYQVLVELYDNDQKIDLVILPDELKRRDLLEAVGGSNYLLELAEGVPTAVNAPHYAKIVRERSILRKLMDAGGRILHDASSSSDPVEAVLDRAEQEVFRIAETRATQDAAELGKLAQELYDQLAARHGQGEVLTGLECGFFEMDEMTSGLQKGELIIVAGRPSMGKAQPLDAKVLTLTGWKLMGDLQVGDALASVDGKPSKVTGVFPQGDRQVYRVTLADGRSTECCAEHLWSVHCRHWPKSRILRTDQIILLLQRKRYQNRLWLDTFSGEFGCDDDLPIDPWLLGCLLGDGSISGTSVRFSTSEPEIHEKVRVSAGHEYELTYAGQYDYRIKQRGGANRKGTQGVRANPIKSALQSLSLWGCESHEKFIPEVYLTGTKSSRLRLLEGLLDTDGWVERWGSIRYATSSKRLAEDVVALVRSLGGTASYSNKNPFYTHLGEKRQGQATYVCNLQLHQPRELQLIQKKQDRLHIRERNRRLNISSIQPTRVVPTQCIAVSHPSHLYVTDEYIVTHNTAFAMSIAEHIAITRKQPVAVFSLEMGRQQLAQRLLCARSGVDSHRLRRNMLREEEFHTLVMTVGEMSDAPLYIDDTPGLSLLALRAKARRLAARHDIKCIIIDYLQLMSAPGAESRQQEVSELSRGIKALARELNVPVICLSQLNRASESREGHKPRMSDLRESGSIEQDADVVILLHREEYYHDDDWKASNSDKCGIAEVIIAKQRNGPVGTVELNFNSQTTRFNNLTRHSGGAGGM